MSGAAKRNKTSLFQSLEAELKTSAAKLDSVQSTLVEAEMALRPFFEDNDILRKSLGAGALTYESSFLSAKKSEPWVRKNLTAILEELRAARSVDPTTCFKCWAELMPSMDRAIANVAATARLQSDKTGLEPELFVKSCLRDAADLLEGSLQTFVRLRLKMLEVAGSRRPNQRRVEDLSFGDVIDELVSIDTTSALYKPAPVGIPVSQWRNIANHNSYHTRGDQVTCAYGPPGKQRKFACSVSDILAVARYVNDLCFMHKVAVEIFSIDNMKQILPAAPKLEISDFTKDSTLAFGLVSAGFSICEVIRTGDEWDLILSDEKRRSKAQVESALQEACFSYALLCGFCHIEAAVRSANVVHRIGFKTSFKRADEKMPNDFHGSVRIIEKDFRLGAQKRI